MTSKINASNAGGGGVVITPDGSGTLELQGGGVTGISISASGVPTISNPNLSGILTGGLANSVVAYLGAPVTMTSANTWYNGPNTGSIGAAGQTWLILAKGEIIWASGAVAGEISIFDGTSYVAGSYGVGANTNWPAMGLAAYYTTLSGATTFTLRAAANVNGASLISSSTSYSVPKTCWIAALRLA